MDHETLAEYQPDIVVVGAGNAAICAALSAHEHGARVLVLEAAPFEERGGNSRYTGGAFRFAYESVEDLKQISPSMADEDLSNVDFGTYTENQFFDDMYALTEYRTDPDLCELLVRNSLETAKWVAGQGVQLHPGLGRQAYKVDGKFKFWGGLALHISGGGEALLAALYQAAEKADIPIVCDTPVEQLLRDGGRVIGVRAQHKGATVDIRAGAVILACGGFESNPAMRTQYLGPGWDLAKVRGTRFNMGAGHRMALDAGAQPYGNWSGCHSVAWDINAPPFGDLTIGDQFQKHNYPYGIIVNARGERYVDEGENFHSHTYAKYGGEILKQPGMFAWQIFDSKVMHLLRNEYRIRRVTKVEADTLEELAAKLEGVDSDGFLRTVRSYNAACRTDIPFDPNILDGRHTEGLAIDKSNWANPLDTAPFHAFHVTTGITFTFGGLKVTLRAEVEDIYGGTVKGLFAAGEIVGGLFYHNYASGTGLMSGATFGRIAGKNAAALAKEMRAAA
ncbi:FAD-dependent tricarballylate dehydrogenase TcuA [Chelativorans sp. AA-79]|uniref:FAD-dependent tricarballylate dehydrogenase TcuA n=1 Tax=Chelativorans sp. AA-79 TaxID=3028735 RepID=UPI0023F89540|nr:FAD-dependent tricarballylate dehydrogenase TcuA [Chelativorans sp. AA-79]WEX10655.1 FAD-dependent tricarballylate dehydrogenase TcuA [Chelativorans sp. AA-79]